MRKMNQYFDRCQHLHGSKQAAEKHCRAWALLHNFAPWSPAAVKANDGWLCPARASTSTATIPTGFTTYWYLLRWLAFAARSPLPTIQVDQLESDRRETAVYVTTYCFGISAPATKLSFDNLHI